MCMNAQGNSHAHVRVRGTRDPGVEPAAFVGTTGSLENKRIDVRNHAALQ